MQAVITDVDPFDLPDWLGTHDVVWHAEAGLRTGHLVRGRLVAEETPELEIACDLVAVDEAYPEPVVDDASRLRVHQAWRHGQVVIGTVSTGGSVGGSVDRSGDRLVLAVPGTRFGPELVLDALGRLARAVGAHAESYAALLRLGA
ncbi:MAG: hypothetical protein ACKOVB_18990 [Terrabacter sp.]